MKRPRILVGLALCVLSTPTFAGEYLELFRASREGMLVRHFFLLSQDYQSVAQTELARSERRLGVTVVLKAVTEKAVESLKKGETSEAASELAIAERQAAQLLEESSEAHRWISQLRQQRLAACKDESLKLVFDDYRPAAAAGFNEMMGKLRTAMDELGNRTAVSLTLPGPVYLYPGTAQPGALPARNDIFAMAGMDTLYQGSTRSTIRTQIRKAFGIGGLCAGGALFGPAGAQLMSFVGAVLGDVVGHILFGDPEKEFANELARRFKTASDDFETFGKEDGKPGVRAACLASFTETGASTLEMAEKAIGIDVAMTSAVLKEITEALNEARRKWRGNVEEIASLSEKRFAIEYQRAADRYFTAEAARAKEAADFKRRILIPYAAAILDLKTPAWKQVEFRGRWWNAWLEGDARFNRADDVAFGNTAEAFRNTYWHPFGEMLRKRFREVK